MHLYTKTFLEKKTLLPRVGPIILWFQYFEQYLIFVYLSKNKIERESKYVVKTEK